jgi:uncharacterized protein YndB with AHSA1/START domain
MDKPKFVYVTYIATTPEKLWEGLTSGDFTEKYWDDGRIQSDWKVGSPVKLVGKNGAIQGEILRVEPPRLLSYTFGSPGLQQDHPSRVVFEIEQLGSLVKLTVTHDELEEKGFKSISGGWPMVLSSLKSLLESGRPLVYEQWRCGSHDASK